MANSSSEIGDDVRQVHIRLLDVLDAICKENGLTYWLEAGTLLGAARQQDFIPWDDDIDIAMPQSDYIRFLSIAQGVLPNDIFLQTASTDPHYRQSFAKLRDCRSTLIERHEHFGEKYHQGIYLDIFPIVAYPDLPDSLRRWMCRLISASRYAIVVNRSRSLRLMMKYAFGMSLWNALTPLRGAHVGQTPEDNGYGCSMSVDTVYPLGTIQFANGIYSAPRDVAGYLTRMYGPSFIAPLPESDRIRHSSSIHTELPCFHSRSIRGPVENLVQDKNPPIAFFAYKDVDRARRSLAALALNPEAPATDLYVFCDGAKNSEDRPGVEAVRDFLKCVKVFRTIEIVCRDQNMGIERNVIDGIQHVLKSNDRTIVIEDDVVVSSTALAYFKRSLKIYESNARAMHIAGCSFVRRSDRNAYFTTYCEMWGWATWKDRWEHFTWYKSSQEALSGLSQEACEKLTFGGEFKCLENLKLNPIPWDICWALVIAKRGGLALSPPVSLVENIGLTDGTHFGPWHGLDSHPYQTVANAVEVAAFPQDVVPDPVAWTEMRDFYRDFSLRSLRQRSSVMHRIMRRITGATIRLKRWL